MMDLPGPVAIVAHDAGAANVILGWLQPEEVMNCRAAMAGPAAELWHGRFPDVPLMGLDDALHGAATLLSGTGWASDLEHDARGVARMRGIRSVAVVDHWTNYRERFARGGRETLPDEIWVTDRYAIAEARRAIPEVPVREQPNLYLMQQARDAGPRPVCGDLLFVSEPARSNWGKDVPGEFQALDYLYRHSPAAGVDAKAALRIRPHPSDSPGKYDAWISAHPGACLDSARDMAEALASASWVAGLQSFALVIAMEAGRPAICALPPGAPNCKLPHEGLIHLRQCVP